MKKDRLLSWFHATCICGCFLGVMTACGPVNRFTRIKKVPREYVNNYCIEGLKAPRDFTVFKGSPWIVFAQESSSSYMSPSGKNEMDKVEYMDAFLVIKEKGDWLKLIKYDPSILKNGRLKEWKKAKYVGWINKDGLLLTRNGITDVMTGFKNKMVLLPNDTSMLVNAEKYFANDTIKLYGNSDLTKEIGKIPMYSIVYPYKKAADGTHTLVGCRPVIDADSIDLKAIGWIDNGLLTSSGQQLHIDVGSLPDESLTIIDKADGDTINLCASERGKSLNLSVLNPAIKYSPVLSYRENDTTFYFRTHLPMPVIDKGDSYVLNVNGNPIYYDTFKNKIEQDLQHINIVFVVEGKDNAISRFPALVNAVQGLQSVLINDESFTFRFGCVLTFNEEGNLEDPICKLTPDYMKMLDFLSEKAGNVDRLKPVYGRFGSWSGVRIGVDMFEKYKDESNILVVVGDKGYNSEWADSTLVNRMVRNNCRLLGFQLYGGEPDNFNNFVLQLGNMIDSYAPQISQRKRELMVYPDLIRNENEYIEVNHNTYCLDFPEKSMTQGWLVFPQKNESLEMGSLTQAVDSMLLQIKLDNTMLYNQLVRAFSEVGTNRYKLDSTFVAYHHIKQADKQTIMSACPSIEPGWSLPLSPVVLPDSLSSILDYYLLVNEDEFKRLRKYIEEPAKLVVDYKVESVRKKKQAKVNICDCPEDYITYNNDETAISIKRDSLNVPEYASTRRVRRKLVRHFLSERNTDKYCKVKRKAFLRMPISESLRRFTSYPVDYPFFEVYRIKDLKKKEMITDVELDKLIEYFKEKKKLLDEAAGKSFQSNGQTYYWISRELLP